jgi:hypothetical protein
LARQSLRSAGPELLTAYIKGSDRFAIERCGYANPLNCPPTFLLAAAFKKGVLTIMLPKSAEAQKAEKKIDVKAS